MTATPHLEALDLTWPPRILRQMVERHGRTIAGEGLGGGEPDAGGGAGHERGLRRDPH